MTYKIISFILIIVHALLLGFLATVRSSLTSILATVLSLITTITLNIIFLVDNRRVTRSTTEASLYLIITGLTDLISLRSTWLRGRSPAVTTLIAFSIVCKALLLGLETYPKSFYDGKAENYAPEDRSALLARVFFWYINPLLKLGDQTILTLSDLYPLNEEFHAENTGKSISKLWLKHKDRENHALLLTILDYIKFQYLGLLPAQLLFSFFRFSQSFLISSIITYLETPSHQKDPNKLPVLLTAAVVIYIGTSTSLVQVAHIVARLSTSFLSASTVLLTDHSLFALTPGLAPLSLITSDLTGLNEGLQILLEIPISFLEVIIGSTLLWFLLGPIAVVPCLVVCVCTYLQTVTSKKVPVLQAEWMAQVEKRVSVATNVLRNMKSVKAAGLVRAMETWLTKERGIEVDKVKKLRWVFLRGIIVTNFPFLFNGLIVFVIFEVMAAVNGTPRLTAAEAFTSLALLNMIALPAARLLRSIPRCLASMGNVQRIESFLRSEKFEDWRGDLEDDGRVVVEVDGLSTKENKEVKPINFKAIKGSLTMVIGPVGCGKSTLLRCMQGEVKATSGSVSLSAKLVGYCGQAPWLPNDTIRSAIIGPSTSTEDEHWYKKILSLCCLDTDFDQFPKGDLAEVGSKGLKLSGGQKQRIALARVLYARCPILLLDDFISGLDERTRNTIVNRLFVPDGFIKQQGITVILVTHLTAYMSLADQLLVLDKQGAQEYAGPPADWDEYIEVLHKGEEKLKDLTSNSTPPEKSTLAAIPPKDDENRQIGDTEDWFYYGKVIGLWPIIAIIPISFMACVGINFQMFILKWATDPGKNMSLPIFIIIYAVSMIIATASITLMIAFILLIIAPLSSINLHRILTKTVLHAPLSLFDKLDSSLLINRFSQDMSLVDMMLPTTIYNVIVLFMLGLIELSLICSGSSYMALSVPVVFTVLYFIQRYYLRTSRQLRLLDIEAKSPLYRHLTESLEGNTTIRALRWIGPYRSLLFENINGMLGPAYTLNCAQRWLSLALDLTVAGMGILVVSLALLVPGSSSGGTVGISMVSILSFNNHLQEFVSNWINAEMFLGAVRRTREFERDVEPEDKGEDDTEEMTMEVGDILWKGVGVVYEDGTRALDNVCVNVLAGENVAITGRTGSGKSTLVSVLLRLVPYRDGEIRIAGHRLDTIPLHTLRKHIICLPQDALIFSAPLKFTLDPTLSVDDEILIKALKQVELWNTLEQRGGLDADLQPDSLSAGEQQLIALARALVRKHELGNNCILVLDEATSNVDAITQEIVRKVVDDAFKGITVIQVAHRGEVVATCQKVIKMDAGKVVGVDKVVPPLS
jgi:ATP-binding cassette subfamily C (CFTR/MRP) protein 1